MSIVILSIINIILFIALIIIFCWKVPSNLAKKQELRSLNEQESKIQQSIMKSNSILEQNMKLVEGMDEQNKRHQETLNKIYDEKKEVLIKQYEEKNKQLEDNYLRQKDMLITQIKEQQTQLDSLKQSYATVIETKKREEITKQNIDAHRFYVNKNELKDISLLNDIKNKLSKPRILSMLIWQTYYQPIVKEKIPLILGKENVCGVYKITNLENEKVYIGQARDIKKRWIDHIKYGLDIDTPKTNILYKDMIQYGIDNYSFEVLEECQPQDLNKKEAFYIDMYNTVNYGYNSQSGVQNSG